MPMAEGRGTFKAPYRLKCPSNPPPKVITLLWKALRKRYSGLGLHRRHRGLDMKGKS